MNVISSNIIQLSKLSIIIINIFMIIIFMINIFMIFYDHKVNKFLNCTKFTNTSKKPLIIV